MYWHVHEHAWTFAELKGVANSAQDGTNLPWRGRRTPANPVQGDLLNPEQSKLNQEPTQVATEIADNDDAEEVNSFLYWL